MPRPRSGQSLLIELERRVVRRTAIELGEFIELATSMTKSLV